MTEYEVVNAWNEVIFALIDAEKAWEKYQGKRLELGYDPLNVLARANYRSKFHIMLPNFIRYCNTKGGIRGLFAPLPTPTKTVEREGILFRKF